MNSTVLLALLFSTFVAANPLLAYGADQKILGDDLKVPGLNPLSFCEKQDNYILKIDHVNLSPSPPLPSVSGLVHFLERCLSANHKFSGHKLIIEAKGNFTQEVVEGAYVVLEIKYGLITLIHQQADLCKQIDNLDKTDVKCPLDGVKLLTKEVKLPSTIPPVRHQPWLNLSRISADAPSHRDITLFWPTYTLWMTYKLHAWKQLCNFRDLTWGKRIYQAGTN